MVEFNTLNENEWFQYQGTMFYVKNGTAKGKTYNAISAEGDAWTFDINDQVVKL